MMNSKKKIYLNGRFLTVQVTGVQRVAYELIKALDELIDKNEISPDYNFILIYSGTIVNQIDLKHIRLLKKGFLTGNLWEQLELPFYTVGSLLVSLCTISTIFKLKQLVMVHDASFLVNPQYFSKAFIIWYKFAIPLLGKISRQILTVSNFSKSELVFSGKFRPEKISVIPNAADHIFDNPKPALEFKEKIDRQKPYCLAVSSLGENKNFQGLSLALDKIDFSKYKMLVAGGVNRTLSFAASDTMITYLGYVSDAELKYLYSNASLFIFPSFYEGFGIPPLEAMTLGCPVIASNTSSLPEVLGDACVYFDPFDPADMAEKISALLSDDEQRDLLRTKGADRAASYSWCDSATKLYELIRSFAD
jgi:glycosyltransferase involved in cell wall biosynthesis